ncbi:hypothetical protein [Streptomyces sp. WM6386]|uniref:hypothetical protein n=1 Tax=Streptomyces sp. WM6386 TaxID=1415558 RepID=UPI0006195E7B|nr:hypothetical protein [Streptomyces sp. WM6386]KKD08964.1 hypothetical protein TN53_05810 [Streptomyces sp. WM6386]
MTPRSDALMILKPDALDGPFAVCPRPLARDAVRGLVDLYAGRPPGPYEVDTSDGAVRWARRNVDRKTAARGWYDKELRSRQERLSRLTGLLHSPALTGDGPTQTAGLILGMAGGRPSALPPRPRPRAPPPRGTSSASTRTTPTTPGSPAI